MRTRFLPELPSSGRTSFAGAQLSGGADFRYAQQFSGETVFSRAQFSGQSTYFSYTQFGGEETSFQAVTFVKEVDFGRATFTEKVDFEGSKAHPVFPSEEAAWFDSVRIEKPELFTFNNVLLHPCWFFNTDMRKVNFTDVKWYGMGLPRLHGQFAFRPQHLLSV